MTQKEVRILICGLSDNSKPIIASLKNKLSSYKYSVVKEFEELKKSLDEFKPDLIIFSYGLESFNCSKVLAHLDELQYEAPIFIISKNLGENESKQCFESGVLQVLDEKELYKLPFIIKELFQNNRRANKIKSKTECHYESIYKSVYDAVNDAIVVHNPNTFAVIDVNPKAVEMFGYSREEMLDFKIGELSDTELGFTTELGKKYAMEAFQKGEVSLEWKAKKKSGISFWVYVTIKPIVVTGTAYLISIIRDINKSREIEMSLISARDQYEALTQNSPDIIMRFDKEHRHIYVNSAIKTNFGLDPELFLNKTHKEMKIFPEHMCMFWEKTISKVFDSGKPHKVVFSVDGPDGLMDMEWRLTPEYNSNGNVEVVLGIARDITESKRQERIQKVLFDIANSVNNTDNLNTFFLRIQSSLHAVIDTTNCYVALYDESSDTLTLPFHRDEKDSFTEFPAGKTTTAYVIRTGKSQLIDLTRISELEAAGEIEPIGAPSIYWLGVPLKIADKIIGVFVVQSYNENIKYTINDVQVLEFVSDQIARAIERKKAQDELKANEERQRGIIESSPDGIVMIDLNGDFLDSNSSFTELVGESNKRVIKHKNIFQYLATDNTLKLKNLLNDTLSTGFSKNIELRMKRRGGSEFFAEASIGLINNQLGKESSFVIVVKNINERKNYEYNLKLAKNKAEEADKLKTAFLSNMSHEIRTPMNAIVGFSELLANVGDDEALKHDFIGQINQGADTLMRLIDDIIDISKIEAGEIKIFKTEFNLGPVLNDIHKLYLTSTIRQGKKQLVIEEMNNGIDSSINIKTDEFRLRQIFTNLLDNAIKFTESGKISFGIKAVKDSRIEFYVADTGIGIAEEYQKIIFERFRQGHSNSKQFYGGTGIGLSISRHLVEQMGGELSLTSQPSKGSEFIFSLPFYNELVSKESDSTKFTILKNSWPGKTIIIAEDAESNYKLLFEVLRRTGIEVLRAKTGYDAINLVKEIESIDLILMDIQMPEMDGYIATREIKKLKPNIPIIAQTAYAMSGEKERSLEYGCDDYLSKPIRSNDLIRILSKYL